ncbi:MAG: glycerol-3-phosphate acyltransferase [Bryobacterales bacterium]|nr:glycerol-3-phosphate acyltransferase [Bryobacterales bacterium]
MAELLSSSLLLRLLLCFALGSIPFAVMSMWGTGVDITRYGSGNPGFNNVLRYSKWRSAVCLAGDAGKGWAAVWLCQQASEPALYGWLFGIVAVLGHSFSPMLGFRGGKGIATGAGAMLRMYPAVLLPCVGLYIVLRMIGGKLQWTERGFIASFSASVLFAVMTALREGFPTAWAGFVLLAFVAWRHKKNIEILMGAR